MPRMPRQQRQDLELGAGEPRRYPIASDAVSVQVDLEIADSDDPRAAYAALNLRYREVCRLWVNSLQALPEIAPPVAVGVDVAAAPAGVRTSLRALHHALAGSAAPIYGCRGSRG